MVAHISFNRSFTISFNTVAVSALFLVMILATACGGETESSGENIYRFASTAGNSFSCATCHALAEPAGDGLVRPGHQIGDATRRPDFKNGELATFREAANTCRRDWMGAPEWSEADPEYTALFDFLESNATAETAPSLSFEIRQPPTDLSGGNMETGQAIFNTRCVVCHGEDAAGSQQAPPLVGDLLTRETVARRVRTSGNPSSQVYPGLTGGAMPFWSTDRLSDSELIDVLAFVESNDPRDGGGGGGGTPLRECDSTHEKIGQTAELTPFAHGVGGTATIVDDCTIEVTSFDFDGQGINVRFYSGLGGDFDSGFSMSEMDLRRNPGYADETVFAQLPDGRTLDELDAISVWCVPVGVSFGDGQFQ